MNNSLMDSFGRRFEYLRLSVTEVCNFRCVYCLPTGFKGELGSRSEELTPLEIERLVKAFVRLGVWKVRISGGEPTTRGDLLEIIEKVSRVEGVRLVALSTNGYRLKSLGSDLVRAGVKAFNVSVDSLDSQVFEQTTGTDRFDSVVSGLDSLVYVPGVRVKVNSVLMKGINSHDSEVERFLEWVKTRNSTVRWIEWMRTGNQSQLDFERFHISAGFLRLKLLREGWKPLERTRAAGPASEYSHPEYVGKVGIIAPYADGFCDNCNRLRVNSRGSLKLCLFGAGGYSLRDYLQSDSDIERIGDAVRGALLRKLPTHRLQEGNYGSTGSLSVIGG